MSITELYVGQDGTLFTIIMVRQTPFIRYKRLPQNDIEELKLLCNDNTKGKSKASSLGGEPAATGAGIATQNHTQGGNILHDV